MGFLASLRQYHQPFINNNDCYRCRFMSCARLLRLYYILLCSSNTGGQKKDDVCADDGIRSVFNTLLRNASSVPAFVRITDMLWSIGVMTNMYPNSPIIIPCSAYSISMDLVVDVKYWDAGPEAVGEDMHMYLKCFFHTRGRVKVQPIFSPASQCNVEGNGYLDGIKARYVQAKRHLWGSLDTGYALRNFIMQIMENGDETVLYESKKSDDVSGIPTYLIMSLFHRLLEAHIIMGHLFIMVAFSTFVAPVAGSIFDNGFGVIHPMVMSVLSFCFWLRTSALIPNIFMIYYYEKYHQFNAIDRWEILADANVEAGLAVPVGLSKLRLDSANSLNELATPTAYAPRLGKRPSLSYQRTNKDLLDWLSSPVSGFIFYVIPQVHVQLTHLFTNRMQYQVAAKPKMEPFRVVVHARSG